jgi:hypothetical protein
MLAPLFSGTGVLYSSESGSEMDESRKSFVRWWLTAEFGSQPEIQNSIRWDGKTTSNIWNNFNQVAHEKTGKPKVMCTTYLCTLVHPRYRRAGSSPMSAHIKASSCTQKPTQRIDQLLKQMVCYSIISIFNISRANPYTQFQSQLSHEAHPSRRSV